MIEPIDLNQFEETRHMEPPKCEDELARVRQELKVAKSQAIQAKAQAVTVTAQRDNLNNEIDRLRQQLKDARDELAVYRLASETAMYEAGQFDAGLFLSGDRGVEDVMRRVLRELAEARRRTTPIPNRQ